jgi:PAS domain S-box-containing protein
MPATAASQLLLAEALGLAVLVLALFWLRRRVGLTPLYVSLGVFQPVQVLLSSSVYVELWQGVSVSPGQVMFAASLLAILAVFVRADALEARKLIYGILGANLVMTLVLGMAGVQLRTPGTANFLALPPAIFDQGARVAAVGTVVFVVDVILLILFYSWLRRLFPRTPFLRVFPTLAGVLCFDALAFTTGAFIERPDYAALLYSGLLSKGLLALLFALLLCAYLRFIEPSETSGAAPNQPLRDFFALGWGDKFEWQQARKDEAESRLDKAQQVARMGFLDWDLHTDLVYWSDEMVHLFGYPSGHNLQTLSKTVELVHPEDREMARASIERAVEGRGVHSLDHRILRDDGSVMWVHAEGELVPGRGGSHSRFLGTLVDITGRKQAEQAIRALNEELEERVHSRTRQLEAANKELEAFSYSVSHDLRAPLRAVTGFAQIVARRHRASLNDEGQRYVDNIVAASERMARLIDDLLEYARLGRKSLRFERVELADVLRHVQADFAPRLAEEGGRLEVAPDLPAVRGEATLLGRLFSNLVDNALTYRRAGEPARVRVSWRRADGKVEVDVADEGVGIAPEHQGKIFDVFQRLHSDEEFAGTGIGLAVVKKVADLLYADVRVESEPGRGSIFTVALPAAPGA